MNSLANSDLDKLFVRRIPHISEEMFCYLDYDSLMEYRRVSKDWKNLLSSVRYRKMAMDMMVEKKNNVRKLWESSRFGNVKEVKSLFSLEVNPNCEYAGDAFFPRGKYYRMALMKAIENGHTEVVTLLLKGGAY